MSAMPDPRSFRRRSQPRLVAQVARRQLLNFLAAGLVSLALWSLVGIVVALSLGGTEAAIDFAWALAGIAVTLILIGIYQGRCGG